MDSKELVYRALAFEDIPRVPYAIDFTVPAREALCADPAGRSLFGRLRNDLLFSPVFRVEWGVRGQDGLYKDEYGLVWDRRIDQDMGIPRPFLTPENMSSYRFPDPREPGRFDLLRNNMKQNPDLFHVLCLDFSFFERAWGMRGMAELMMDLLDRPDFAATYLDRIMEFNLQIVEEGLKACPDVDAVHFSDDFGSQIGIFMGPELWRRFFKPRLAKQYAAAKAAGKKVCIHSCGRIEEILDDLVEIGVNLFNPFQPEVLDVPTVHARYHGRLAFSGGISTQKLLPFATPEEVERQVRTLLTMGRRGGYVIAPAHATPGDARTDNVIAMLTTILGQP
jgi:uroporphyrinogen decarboxylase